MKVEIRLTPEGQELWISDRWCVTHPRLLDGNLVAHNIALEATRAGFPISYKLVDAPAPIPEVGYGGPIE